MKDLNSTTTKVLPLLRLSPEAVDCSYTEVSRCAPDKGRADIAVGEDRPLPSAVVPMQRSRRASNRPSGRPGSVTMAWAAAAGLRDELPDLGAVIEKLRR
ncbi:hypothetical protein AB0E82_20875 [Streptomyces anulatus]|uniref:hypothetical protein n=1 Tax=Streptomyces anulatus TaxID=1892 RepID=UPI0033FDD985